MITLELSHPRQGLITSPAFPPPAGVVDTLGAGDTFNATVIFIFANVDIILSCLNCSIFKNNFFQPNCKIHQ